MDAFRRKGSRISSLADRNRVVKPMSDSHEGKRQVLKQKKSPRFSSDSSSCRSDTLGEDTLTFELGWRSSYTAVGTPMKSLLAKEMSKENESKRRSPSIIARLMGLDGLPPQNLPGHKQHKSVENHHHHQRSSSFHSHRSSRKSSKDEQEFKDVFEVSDTTKVENSSNSKRCTGNSNLTAAEMAFIQQKFMEAKRLSTDEKLQNSKEFHDALEALDSNKDLLLKFLQHPDSLFTKHLQDLQCAVPELQCAHMTALKSSQGPRHGKSVPCQKTHKHPAAIPSHPQIRQVACDNGLELPRMELEEKNTVFQPTRIVVLKPNLGKTRNADRTLSSPSSSSDDFRADSRLPCARNWESEFWDKKKGHEDASLTRHKGRESREIAKEITRNIRTSCGKSDSMNFQASGFRGYAGDESSSGSDSPSESELLTVASRANFNRKNRHRSSSSCSTESSVSREAKKRLSERWRLTHKSNEVGEVSRSSTLAEMLAISDKEARPANFNGVIFEEGQSKVEPLGISSKDALKNEFIRNLSNSRSRPRSSSPIRNPKMMVHRQNPRDDKSVMLKETTKRERNKLVKGKSDHNEAFLLSNSMSSSKKSQASCNTSPEISFSPSQERNFYGEDQSFDLNITSDIHTLLPIDVNSDADNVADSGNGKITVSSEASPLDLSAATSSTGNLLPCDLDVLRYQELSGGASKEPPCPSAPELKSLASAKEGDQPSPVSVLEASFPDDFSSSSECFESLSADLHGLRMQLQLLKLESGAYEEGRILISSDEDADHEESPSLMSEKIIIRGSEEDWKSSYLVDVLVNSKFSDADPDTFMASWHSSECPVSPSLFEDLEKKYSDLTYSTRCQRKFLFDSINSELLVLFQQFTDPHPWVKPTRVSPKWDLDELQDTLRKLVTKKDEKASREAREKVFERESRWLNLEDDIDVIGREIEKMLTDELLAQIVADHPRGFPDIDELFLV